LAGSIDDAPARARFEAALEHRLVPVLGELPLLEAMNADRHELHRRMVDACRDEDDGDTRECLRLILEGAAEDLRARVLDVRAPVVDSRSRREVDRSGPRGGQPAGRRRFRAAVPSK
jgi:hypothetical protein